MPDYHFLNGTFRSDLSLPELTPARGLAVCWQLTRSETLAPALNPVMLGEEPVEPGVRVTLVHHEQGLRLSFDDTGVFDISADGAEIAWRPPSAPDLNAVRKDILGRVISVALHQQGLLALHGSAVELGGRAIAFLAPKFHGKSTTAAALVERGARLLADDLVVVSCTKPLTVLPSVPVVQLWEDSARSLSRGSLAAPDLRGWAQNPTSLDGGQPACLRAGAAGRDLPVGPDATGRLRGSRPPRTLDRRGDPCAAGPGEDRRAARQEGAGQPPHSVRYRRRRTSRVPARCAKGFRAIGGAGLGDGDVAQRRRGPERARLTGPRGLSVVRVHGLQKSFPVRRSWRAVARHPLRRDRTAVLQGISLEVGRGEFFGLLGPNGAGKTTLFKILATLVVPEAGTVEVAGLDALEHPGAVRAVLTPVIADERSLNWRLTGSDNLELFAALYGIPAAERTAAVNGVLETVGIAEARRRMVGTYSSGMKQRLLVARALLSRPSVLLLDEPTRSLDPVTARDFRRFLKEEIAGRQGCTVILATHDAEEALELCDRLAVLDRGRIVAQGTASELARIAGERRFRVVIGRGQETLALRLLADIGLASFARTPAVAAEGWVTLEGDLPGGRVRPPRR